MGLIRPEPRTALGLARALGRFRVTTVGVLTLGFVVLVVAGAGVRHWAIKDRPLCGYLENDDATAHVLTTCVAYGETPARVHHFLPLFTLGDTRNKGIDNLPGAAAADADGNYYYTSFPPLGFVAAYIGTGAIVGLEPTPLALRRFSLGLHLALVGLTLWIVVQVLREVTPDPAGRWLGALAAGTVVWAAPEMLTSYTITYWAHHLYQVIFALQLVCLCARRVGTGFGLLCAAACLTEWTGFVVNAGVVGLGLLRWRCAGDRRGLAEAGWAAVGTVVGAMLLIGWFASVIPVDDYLANLAGRFRFRQGTAAGTLPDLLRGYVSSAGLFLMVPVLVVLQVRRPLLDCGGYDRRLAQLTAEGLSTVLRRYPRAATVIGLTCCALAENLLCMQHALAYTYDRVKFVYLLAMVAAVLVGWFGSRTLTAGLLLLGTVTLIQFVTAARGPDPLVTYWRHLDAHYGALIQQAARDDESVFMTGPVRGSKTYYSRRNIVELPSRFDDPDETIRRNGDFIRERTRTAGAQTALVVLPRDEIPVFQSGFHSAFPRPASLYRLDVSTGAFVRLAPVTP